MYSICMKYSGAPHIKSEDSHTSIRTRFEAWTKGSDDRVRRAGQIPARPINDVSARPKFHSKAKVFQVQGHALCSCRYCERISWVGQAFQKEN